MTKKITATQIKKLASSDKAIIGTDQTLEKLKMGKVEQVLVSSNCPQKVLDDIDHYAKLSGAETVFVGYTNEELGVICKKPFSISVLSVLKA